MGIAGLMQEHTCHAAPWSRINIQSGPQVCKLLTAFPPSIPEVGFSCGGFKAPTRTCSAASAPPTFVFGPAIRCLPRPRAASAAVIGGLLSEQIPYDEGPGIGWRLDPFIGKPLVQSILEVLCPLSRESRQAAEVAPTAAAQLNSRDQEGTIAALEAGLAPFAKRTFEAPVTANASASFPHRARSNCSHLGKDDFQSGSHRDSRGISVGTSARRPYLSSKL